MDVDDIANARGALLATACEALSQYQGVVGIFLGGPLLRERPMPTRISTFGWS